MIFPDEVPLDNNHNLKEVIDLILEWLDIYFKQ